jgi:hypothetical protein
MYHNTTVSLHEPFDIMSPSQIDRDCTTASVCPSLQSFLDSMDLAEEARAEVVDTAQLHGERPGQLTLRKMGVVFAVARWETFCYELIDDAARVLFLRICDDCGPTGLSAWPGFKTMTMNAMGRGAPSEVKNIFHDYLQGTISHEQLLRAAVCDHIKSARGKVETRGPILGREQGEKGGHTVIKALTALLGVDVDTHFSHPLDDVPSPQRVAIGYGYAVGQGPLTYEAVLDIRGADQWIRLLYGMRCIFGHGSRHRTLEGALAHKDFDSKEVIQKGMKVADADKRHAESTAAWFVQMVKNLRNEGFNVSFNTLTAKNFISILRHIAYMLSRAVADSLLDLLPAGEEVWGHLKK